MWTQTILTILIVRNQALRAHETLVQSLYNELLQRTTIGESESYVMSRKSRCTRRIIYASNISLLVTLLLALLTFWYETRFSSSPTPLKLTMFLWSLVKSGILLIPFLKLARLSALLVVLVGVLVSLAQASLWIWDQIKLFGVK